MISGHVGTHYCCCCHLTWDYNVDIIAIPDGVLTVVDDGEGGGLGDLDDGGVDAGVVIDVDEDVIAVSDEEYGGIGGAVAGGDELGGESGDNGDDVDNYEGGGALAFDSTAVPNAANHRIAERSRSRDSGNARLRPGAP